MSEVDDIVSGGEITRHIRGRHPLPVVGLRLTMHRYLSAIGMAVAPLDLTLASATDTRCASTFFDDFRT